MWEWNLIVLRRDQEMIWKVGVSKSGFKRLSGRSAKLHPVTGTKRHER